MIHFSNFWYPWHVWHQFWFIKFRAKVSWKLVGVKSLSLTPLHLDDHSELMARPSRIQYPDDLHQGINRRNARQVISKDDADQAQFLFISNNLQVPSRFFFAVLCCWTITDIYSSRHRWPPLRLHAPLLCFTYTSHYNRRHTRVGHLYQGRHKSYLIEIETYLLHVSRYIHLNPDKVTSITKVSPDKKLHFLTNYQWSSLHGYPDQTREHEFVAYATVHAQFCLIHLPLVSMLRNK